MSVTFQGIKYNSLDEAVENQAAQIRVLERENTRLTNAIRAGLAVLDDDFHSPSGDSFCKVCDVTRSLTEAIS